MVVASARLTREGRIAAWGRPVPLRGLWVAAALGFLAMGCSRSVEEAHRPIAYDCEGLRVVANFSSEDTVRLRLPQRAVRLEHVAAASGAKYQGEGVTFWTKGSNEALLVLGDQRWKRCSAERNGSPSRTPGSAQ